MTPSVRCTAILAHVALLVAWAGPAHAATLSLESSTLALHLVLHGEPLSIEANQSPASIPVFVSSGSGSFVQPTGAFATNGALPLSPPLGTSPQLFSVVYSIATQGGSFGAGGGPGGGFGGGSAVAGSLVLDFHALVNLSVPLTVAGGGGVVQASAAALKITVTGHAGWTTGTASVTAVSSPTPGGGFANTVVMSGADLRDASHRGSLLLATPFRILSNGLGNSANFFTQTLSFVPEPGTVLLLGCGAGLLTWAGSRKR